MVEGSIKSSQLVVSKGTTCWCYMHEYVLVSVSAHVGINMYDAYRRGP